MKFMNKTQLYFQPLRRDILLDLFLGNHGKCDCNEGQGSPSKSCTHERWSCVFFDERLRKLACSCTLACKPNYALLRYM